MQILWPEKGKFMSEATKLRWLEKAQKLLSCLKHLGKGVWPPSSPDCNPLDYYVWGVAEWDVNNAPHNTKESLITKIMEVFGNMLREEVTLDCNRFHGRLEKVMTANGDFIEYIYS